MPSVSVREIGGALVWGYRGAGGDEWRVAVDLDISARGARVCFMAQPAAGESSDREVAINQMRGSHSCAHRLDCAPKSGWASLTDRWTAGIRIWRTPSCRTSASGSKKAATYGRRMRRSWRD